MHLVRDLAMASLMLALIARQHTPVEAEGRSPRLQYTTYEGRDVGVAESSAACTGRSAQPASARILRGGK